MDTLQAIGHFIYQFFFLGVIGYILKKWLADKLMQRGKIWIHQTDRTMAIWSHYMSQVQGKGHKSDSVLDCSDAKCQIFGTYAR